MSDLQRKSEQELGQRMREEWDRRIRHDYRYWMSDGVASDQEMWAVGERDFTLLTEGIAPEWMASRKALEIGCGVGRLVSAAASRFEHVTGVDVSVEAITKARDLLHRCPNVSLFVGNGVDLDDISTSSVDFVYSFAALGSMPVRVVAGYLKEISRILVPGGVARIQLFLGSPQETCEEDTIGLRSFEMDRFIEAAVGAGFAVNDLREVKLNFEVSNPEEGLIAMIAVLQRKMDCTRSVNELAELLLPGGELQAGSEWNGSETEYLMALARATQHMESGEYDAARAALEFAIQNFDEVDADVKAFVAELGLFMGEPAPSLEIPSVIQVDEPMMEDVGACGKRCVDCGTQGCSDKQEFVRPAEMVGEHFATNINFLNERFPWAALAVRATETPRDTNVVLASGGFPVGSFRGVPLCHAEKPVRAGENWAEQTLNADRIKNAEELIIVGMGLCYHVEALLTRTDKKIHLVEPMPEISRLACENRDLRAMFARLASVTIGADAWEKLSKELRDQKKTELVVFPPTQQLAGSAIDDLGKGQVLFDQQAALRSRQRLIWIADKLQLSEEDQKNIIIRLIY